MYSYIIYFNMLALLSVTITFTILIVISVLHSLNVSIVNHDYLISVVALCRSEDCESITFLLLHIL
jgi:hypothetical protein